MLFSCYTATFYISATIEDILPLEAVLSKSGIIKYKWSSKIMISKEGRIFIASEVKPIKSTLRCWFWSAKKSACFLDYSINERTSGKTRYMCEKSLDFSSGLLISCKSFSTFFGYIDIITWIISKIWSANFRIASGISFTINMTIPKRSCVR